MVYIIILAIITLIKVLVQLLITVQKSYNYLIVLFIAFLYRLLDDYEKDGFKIDAEKLQDFQFNAGRLLKEFQLFLTTANRNKMTEAFGFIRYAFFTIAANLSYYENIDKAYRDAKHYDYFAKISRLKLLKYFIIIPYLERYSITVEVLTTILFYVKMAYILVALYWIFEKKFKKYKKKKNYFKKH